MNLKENTLKNEQHFDAIYENVDITYALNVLHDLDHFLADAKVTDASWVGLYHNNFDKELKGKKVLELGCGDCLNAAIMSVLGAEVYANDISQVSGKIIDQLSQNYAFERPIQFVHGDFLESDLPENFFDIVIGKAFVHHLTNEQEVLFTKKIVKILKPDGLVRYFEPAINSKFLDSLRYMVPVSHRPSSLQRKKFKLWKEEDPHPHRDDSSKTYKIIGEQYFKKTEIICFGCIERFYRLLPYGNFARKFRRLAFKMERLLPRFINNTFSRSQLIIYQFPKKD